MIISFEFYTKSIVKFIDEEVASMRIELCEYIQVSHNGRDAARRNLILANNLEFS